MYRNCAMLLGIALAPARSQRWQNQLGSPQAECLSPKDRVSDLALSFLSEFISLKVDRPLSLAKHPQLTHTVSQIDQSKPCNCPAGCVSNPSRHCLLTTCNCKHIFLHHAPTQANTRQKHMTASTSRGIKVLGA